MLDISGRLCYTLTIEGGDTIITYDRIRNLTTGETHYFRTVCGVSRWDSEGRVDSRTQVEELDRETWEELKAEAELFEELSSILSEE